MATEKLDVATLQTSDDGKIALHSALLTLQDSPAWDVVLQFLQMQAEVSLKLCAASYQAPAEVAFYAGRYDALEFLRTMTQRLGSQVVEIMDQRSLVEQHEQGEKATRQVRRRADMAGEVSG